MEFGRVTASEILNRIDFRLPNEDQRSTNLLNCFSSSSSNQIYFGLPIWGHAGWVGKLYPKGTSQKEYLRFYSQQLNTIELNTTFYRIPEVSQVENWRKVVPKSFRFSPKVFQGISQFSDLQRIPELTQSFCNSIQSFREQLGLPFLQLPPSFGPNKLIILKRFFTLLPKAFPLAIEFRHPAWFQNGHLISPAFDLLADHGISTVITDVAGRRDVLHSTLTTSSVLIRFVGNSLHPSDWGRIDTWVERIGNWLGQGVRKVYFFIHQQDQVGALELVDDFVLKMNQRLNLALKSWSSDLASPQRSLFG